jgi:hypothetical protein
MGGLAKLCGFIACCSVLAANAAEPDCVPQTQVDVTKIVPQVILIGEAHGTVEIPQFTLGVVCSLLKAGKSVILGVEYTGEQQDALNRYLLSPGGAADRQDLLQGRNWKRYSDGRGSVAMFELVDGMRRLRQQGQRVGVLAFQSNENLDVPMEVADRTMIVGEENKLLNRINDADMASTVLRESVLYRRYVLVILSGYSHTSTILSTFNTEMFGTYKPMGQLVSEQTPVFTIGIDTGGGAHAHGVKTYPIEPGPLYVIGTQIDAHVSIEHLTPSPVARDAVK